MNVSLEGDWKIFSTPSLSNFDRWSVGYSNLFDTLRAIPEKSPATYPPHNIIKKSDNEWGYDLEELNFYPDLKDGETCEFDMAQEPKLKQYTGTKQKYIRECVRIDIQ